MLGEKIKMESVEVKELSFAYENTDTLILKNLNMQIQEGDFVCLLGQSGCGKSTLLRLLAGLEKPTNGEILIDGKPIKGASLERSVVFQDYGLFPWMTAGENIVLALKQKFPKQKKSELKAIAKEMLVKVGLDESVYGKLPKELSGGMKQRCAIARSFSINPPVLLMDEPFGALDAVTRARLQEMVLDLWKSDETKKIVFFVTHDVDEALLLANKIFVLGQKPSSVIYSCEIPEEDKPDRNSLYENVHIMKLRNELIKYINQDVTEHIE
ncbi:ABC transporter ATP-binding protein [Dorea formicigenerans]|uniref:ABC transporter ATP-binding protein n=1 Tax=Dorea formicigenerans TaxID=39486 RepID=A0A413VNY8_9FIRM|nr:ABC transporter ATP-binding protein [Dorea formicigenerans]RHB35350.1 ABC transporter ATP-binding protein [Dorea formicigenerans]